MAALLPQDVLVALKLAVLPERPSYADLGTALGLSTSQAHAAVKRLRKAGILRRDTSEVIGRALHEFLVHAVKYVFPAERGPVTRGMPTAHSAAPLSSVIQEGGLPVVWPAADGEARGEAFLPIYKTAPAAARADETLYAMLALVDAIRGGRARERTLAETKLGEMLRAGTNGS